jgi:TPR repeat protein
MRNYPILAVAALAVAGAAAFRPAAGATDAVFIESGAPDARSAPSYESGYVADARRHGLGENTPEADARPGEVFFLRAAEAVRKHDYTFAIQMYEVSASWAYKPAEYNLGVMYAHGQGVPVDLPRAMAWMALAAERNDKHYVDAREAVYAAMTKEQFDQANVIWRELKKTYGDQVALKRAKARWAEVKSHMTGSRVGSVGNLSVGAPEQNGNLIGSPKLNHDIAAAAERGTETRNGFKTPAQIEKDVNSKAYSGATSSADILGGQGVDGSIAYRQLRESDNPYDTKFRTAAGTAIVGPPESVKAKADDKKTPDDPADTEHQEPRR